MTVPRDRMALSIAEYSQRMGISEKAARQQVARRQIPFRKIGRKVVILVSELEEFLGALPGVSADEAARWRS